jgi:hypothetical protein
MGETVDALVVGASRLVLRSSSRVIRMTLFKLETTDPGSVEEVYRPLYARFWMIGMHHRQMKNPSKRPWRF